MSPRASRNSRSFGSIADRGGELVFAGRTKRLIPQDAPQRPEPILPSNFFPFGPRAANVADRPLIESDAGQARQLERQLQLDPKAAFGQARGNLLHELAANHFVASFGVGQ